MKRIHDYAGRETVLDVEQREFLRGLVQFGVLDTGLREQILKRAADSIEGCGNLSLKELARLVVLTLHARRLDIHFNALAGHPNMYFRSWKVH